MYFRHFIAKHDTIFKDICFKQGTQFCSACSSIGLICYWPAKWLFRGQILFYYYARIILLLLFSTKFYRNQFFQKIVFFSFLRSGVRKGAFSESCSLIGGVVLSDAVLSLVKICKKYIEVNHSLLLICSLKK